MSRRWPVKIGSALLGGMFTLGFGAAMLGAGALLGHRGDEYKFLDPLIDIKALLNRQYVEVPDDQVLIDGAINGMLEALNDPYTVYVPPAQKTEFNKDLTGEYVGIGASVLVVDGWLTIVSPLEDSPAYKVGLLADDKVVEVDGKSTHNLGVDECIKMLMGEPGTSVKLTVERKGERLEVPIVREHIKTKSVKGFHRDDLDANRWLTMVDPARKIAYLRLTQFTPGCAEELAQALEAAGAKEGKLGGLVLDLRGNPGGLLSEAITIADLFLKDGTIVSTKGRAFPEDVVTAKAPGTLPDFPIALVMNGQSASASEVLAGALTENMRAVSIGTRSFGKGLVQSVHQLPGGRGEIKITEQRYYLPSGRCIQRTDDAKEWGVDPSDGMYVPMTDDETIAMLRARRDEEIMKPAGEAKESGTNWSDPHWIVDHLKDKQLGAAVEAIQAKADTGEWKKVGTTEGASKAIAANERQRLRLTRERLERELVRVDKREAAIESAAGDPDTSADFWPDSLDLNGGTLKVFDKDGKLVSELAITGPNLERWLIDADVKKKDAPTPATTGPGT